MSPEEVLQSLYALSSSTQQQYPSALTLAAQAPLLLQQHPATTSAALQQLRSLLPDQLLTQELLHAAPELLLMGPQLQQRLAAAAALLSLSVTQLAVALIKEPTLWWVVMPRHTWPFPGQQQQQQQRGLSPATALAVESMAALQSCKLRPPAVMQQVAVLHPLLLKLGAVAIQQRLQLLQDACAKCGQWQQQLQSGLHPELLGRAILRIGVWHKRMEFLVQYGYADRLRLSEVIALSRSDFEKNFSFDYSGWKLEGKHQRRRAEAAAAAAAAAAERARYGGSAGQYQQQQQWEEQLRLAWLQQQAMQRQQQRQPQVQQQMRPALQQQQLEDDFVGVLQAFAAGGGNAAAGNSSSSSGGSSSNTSTFAGYVRDLGPDPPLQEQQQQQWQQSGEGDDAVYYLAEEDEEDDDEDDDWSEDSSSSSSSSQSNTPADSADSAQQEDELEFKPGWQMRRYTIMVADDKGRPETHVHTHVPLVFQTDKQLLSVQQSGLELYGSWQGSLVQPRDLHAL
jgi:hypothetical protein